MFSQVSLTLMDKKCVASNALGSQYFESPVEWATIYKLNVSSREIRCLEDEDYDTWSTILSDKEWVKKWVFRTLFQEGFSRVAIMATAYPLVFEYVSQEAFWRVWKKSGFFASSPKEFENYRWQVLFSWFHKIDESMWKEWYVREYLVDVKPDVTLSDDLTHLPSGLSWQDLAKARCTQSIFELDEGGKTNAEYFLFGDNVWFKIYVPRRDVHRKILSLPRPPKIALVDPLGRFVSGVF